MKKLMLALAACAVCAFATAQPGSPPSRDGERMENHDMDRPDGRPMPMAHEEPRHAESHEKHKVWVPSHHESNGHRVPGHYEYRDYR